MSNCQFLTGIEFMSMVQENYNLCLDMEDQMFRFPAPPPHDRSPHKSCLGFLIVIGVLIVIVGLVSLIRILFS